MPKSEPHKITPSLESITITGKYEIPLTDFKDIVAYLQETLGNWMTLRTFGDSIRLLNLKSKSQKKWDKELKQQRAGNPFRFSVVVIERSANGIIVEVQCVPAMWYRIVKWHETSFAENDVQEALLECGFFVKEVMSGLKGREIQPISVYPIIQRREVKNRLLNLGLKKIVSLLDKAEKQIVQNSFTESLKSARTAFEKMIDWQMKKRGLEQTSNYKNDLARLRSKGYLDKETERLLHTYYQCLSNTAVHEKGEVEPGIFEAQLGYGMTLITLQYLVNKLP